MTPETGKDFETVTIKHIDGVDFKDMGLGHLEIEVPKTLRTTNWEADLEGPDHFVEPKPIRTE